jgi:hypothetical protein
MGGWMDEWMDGRMGRWKNGIQEKHRVNPFLISCKLYIF